MLRVSIEGNLAAGKSTLLGLLEGRHAYEIAPEPVQQWQHVVEDEDTNILQLFYQDPKRWAHTFQLYAFSSRLKHQRQTATRSDTKLLLMERSMESDKHIFAKNCFVSGLMNRVEFAIYNDLHSYWTEHAPSLDAVIYLRTEPEVCYERLLHRHRGEEMSITVDYLRQIHQRHEEWIPTITDKPVFVVNNIDSLSESHKNNLIGQVDSFLASLK